MSIIKRYIYIDAYTAHNVGDDIFLKILLERYSNEHFVLVADKGYKKSFRYYENVTVIERKIIVLLYNKIMSKLHLQKFTAECIISKLACFSIEIGGSLFQEPSLPSLSFVNKEKYCVLGSNFGPYYSESYLLKVRRFLKNAKDVCFRDKASYNYFKDLSNVRYASDIAFLLNENKANEGEGVFISVMNFKSHFGRKDCLEFEQDYEAFLLSIIYETLKNKKTVRLVSFCNIEKDDECIDNLIKKLDCKEKKLIKVIKYKCLDDLDLVLESINESKIVIGARFHSIVLGLLYGKYTVPISYNVKTDNLIKDLGYEKNILHLKKLNEEVNLKNHYIKLSKNEIEKLKNSAEEQFKYLDGILES